MGDWYSNIEKEIRQICKHKWVIVAQQMKCEYCGQVYEVK